MKTLLPLVLLFTATWFAPSATSQTLQEKLSAEDPVTLAQLAREQGNIVRGAILFHQGNINCAKCHRAQAEAQRIGPDLSRMEQDTTDSFLVESILAPSKVIKKGFESATILTVEGKIFNGIIIQQDADQIVLRDRQDVENPVTIDMDDVDEIKPSKLSSMPDNLANEMKDRQQFLDLIRYLIDVKERGPTEVAEIAMQPAQRRELSDELNGLVLISENNCAACHSSPSIARLPPPKQAPRLKGSSQWLNPNYIAKFIADPHQTKPGTSMPNLLANLDENSSRQTAEMITHFLTQKSGNRYAVSPIDPQAVTRGHESFHSLGCVACHSPRDTSAIETSPATEFGSSKALGDLSEKYSLDGLVAFLEDPHAVRPSGRMPNMKLTHFEATDIANYLLQNILPSDKWKTNDVLAVQGKQLFQSLQCASCHSEILGAPEQPASRLSLAELDPKQGCLSAKSGNWPRFNFADNEIRSIQTALSRESNELTSQQQIDVSLASLNCIACHDRDNFGGVDPARSPHFKTTNLNLGDQGRIPPTLTGAGAKLNPKWMRDVLVNGRSIRPYMKTRMPQFGESNIGGLIELFQETDKLKPTEFAKFEDQKVMREMGLKLAGSKGLNCVACHTYQYKQADTMPAVDLTEMTERLKKDWFHQYMLAPQDFSLNTVMPSFWPGGNAIRKDLEGDAPFQVEALWQYLIDGRQARMPSGVVREPLEIVVTDEAKMLRRSYSGIGKRGIGVGYPGGVNLAFDAEQMRISMVWQGKFVDPAGVWRGQGHGTVRPMSRPIEFAKGPELDDSDSPWTVGLDRPPHHQFLGYELDSARRPTFSYSFHDVQVKDGCKEAAGADGKMMLRRKVSLSSPQDRDSLRFRVVTAKEISVNENGDYLIGKQLKIRIAADAKPNLVDDGETKTLSIPINLNRDEPQTLVIEYLFF
ncbi:MAG: putative heme-binding domain-containing protein [Mariniblastus sp.]